MGSDFHWLVIGALAGAIASLLAESLFQVSLKGWEASFIVVIFSVVFATLGPKLPAPVSNTDGPGAPQT